MPEEQDPWYMLFPSLRVYASFREHFSGLNQRWLIAGSYAFFGLMSDALGHRTFQFSVGTSCLFGYMLETVVFKKKRKPREAKRNNSEK